MMVTCCSYSQCSEDLRPSVEAYAKSCAIGCNFEMNKMIVATIDKIIVGILIYGEPSSYYKNLVQIPAVYLLRVHVEEEHRRKGIANRLVYETLNHLQNLALFVEIKMPKVGESDLFLFITSLKEIKELPSFFLENETYKRYIIKYARDGTRGSG